MKRLHLILIGLLLIPSLFLTSCDQGDTPETTITPAFTTMKDYMITNDLDINKVINNGINFVAGAPADADLDAFLNKYYIIDIRSAADFTTKGHIAGAKNVAFANILTEGAAAQAAGKPALVVCYTGQTACYATALMRMYGYSNTQALKWGMSGWNENTAYAWNNAVGNEANGHANWSYGAAPSNNVYDDPEISSLSTIGENILKSRVELAVQEGFKTVKGTDVLNSPNNYFINNFFSSADYTGFGHINGAYRINPLTLADNSYRGLDPTQKVVTYCYTGQTSAVVTACLRVLGYDAYSLTFGMNGMYNTNSAFSSNQWGYDSKPKSLPLVQ
jgi:rhodanese-related sulfurtransferase